MTQPYIELRLLLIGVATLATWVTVDDVWFYTSGHNAPESTLPWSAGAVLVAYVIVLGIFSVRQARADRRAGRHVRELPQTEEDVGVARLTKNTERPEVVDEKT